MARSVTTGGVHASASWQSHLAQNKTMDTMVARLGLGLVLVLALELALVLEQVPRPLCMDRWLRHQVR